MFTLKFQGWEGGDLVLSTDSDSMQMSWSPFSGGGGGGGGGYTWTHGFITLVMLVQLKILKFRRCNHPFLNKNGCQSNFTFVHW